jgi:AcrR family transcriptional regulator
MLDPRILRTRRLLQGTLENLLRTREFTEISVEEIVHAAHLDRATFDEHYEDKTSLLECMVAGWIGELLEKHRVRFDGSSTDAMKGVALCVCDCLAALPNRHASRFDPHLESAVIEVVRWIVLEGIAVHLPVNGTSAAMVASTAAWGIYGAAKEWLSVSGRSPAQGAAETIARMVSPMVEAPRVEALTVECEKLARPRVRSWAS